MKIHLNLSLAYDLRIEAVEMVTKTGFSEVELCVLCKDADELSLLQGLNIGDETIEIEDSIINEKGR